MAMASSVYGFLQSPSTAAGGIDASTSSSSACSSGHKSSSRSVPQARPGQRRHLPCFVGLRPPLHGGQGPATCTVSRSAGGTTGLKGCPLLVTPKPYRATKKLAVPRVRMEATTMDTNSASAGQTAPSSSSPSPDSKSVLADQRTGASIKEERETMDGGSLFREVARSPGAAALLFRSVVEIDHYARLGCGPDSQLDEIVNCFTARCKEISADTTLSEDAAKEKLDLVKKSFDILGTDEKRRLYDWGLLVVSRPDDVHTWPYEADITQRIVSSDKPPKNTFDIDDSEGNKPWIYFFAGWMVLSVIVNIFF